jgi:hypothetical protein
MKFGKGVKLSPRFVELVKVLEKKGHVAYQLVSLDSLMSMHNIFHVSVLQHYVSDLSHVIGMSSL